MTVAFEMDEWESDPEPVDLESVESYHPAYEQPVLLVDANEEKELVQR